VRAVLGTSAENAEQGLPLVWREKVELAPLADPAFVRQSVAAALGVQEQPGRPILATLSDHLRDKHLLILLDNWEHLIEACAKFADMVLHTGRETRILASSREALVCWLPLSSARFFWLTTAYAAKP
jgi:predicted ATPase